MVGQGPPYAWGSLRSKSRRARYTSIDAAANVKRLMGRGPPYASQCPARDRFADHSRLDLQLMRLLPPTPLRLLCLALALWAALFPPLGAFASTHVAVDSLGMVGADKHWSLDHDGHRAHVHADTDHADSPLDSFVHLLAHELSCCPQSFAPSPLSATATELLAPEAPAVASPAPAPTPRLDSLLRPPIS